MGALPSLPSLLRPTAAFIKATALDIAILAGHAVLYPTGVTQERPAWGTEGTDGALSVPAQPESAEVTEVTKAAAAAGAAGAAERARHEAAHASPGSASAGATGSAGPPGSGPARSPGRTSAAGPAGPAGAAGSAGAAVSAETASLPAAASRKGAPGTPPSSHRPVILLHGFIDNRSVFVLLRRSLRQHGWDQVEALNYSPLSCDIRAAAALLGRHIEEVCARTGHTRVDVVGHSLGGLIARYYVQRLGGDSRVRTLVTLGTPHSGTRAVPLLSAHPIVRQMRPDSDVMKELARPAPGCATQFVSFWSNLDQLMAPLETAQLHHPDLIAHNVQVSGIGHLALPVHGAVAAGIRQALDAAATGGDASEAASVA